VSQSDVDGLVTPLHVTVVVAKVVLRWVMEEVRVGAAEAESAPTAAARRDREARAIFATLCVFVAGALAGCGRKARDLIARQISANKRATIFTARLRN
jgi:hypothetical protein